MTLHLVPNKDIAASLGAIKRKEQVLVGFALETNDETAHASDKLKRKNLDFIVLNSLQNKGTCFMSDENQITILSAQGSTEYERKSKADGARDIVEHLVKTMYDKH